MSADSSSLSHPAKNHGTILRASIFTGGAQVFTSLASLVRGKLSAVYLGVAGVGLSGLLMQASSLIQSFVGLGLGSSGVRAIAAARGKGDSVAVAKAYAVLRAWSWATGLVSGLLCILFSKQLSLLTFDNDQHTLDFAFVGIAAFLQQLYQGQSALLRGMGKIKELASLNVAASLSGLLLTVPCFIFWGSAGIAPSLALTASAAFVCSWWHARREIMPEVQMKLPEIFREGQELARIGMAFVGTAVAGMAANYITGRMIRVEIGLEGNGYYQAASGITIVLVGFVLSAMGQDYYPRLSAVIHKKDEAAALIRDQTEMAVLLASPILVAVSSLAPWLLKLAFSAHFVAAAPAVTCLALGCLLRIVSWPLGFALLAEGRPLAILAYEVTFSALSVGLAWGGLMFGGLVGAAASFALLYLLYWVAMSCLISSRVGFLPSRSLLGMILGAAVLVALGNWMHIYIGLFVSLATALYCARSLLHHLEPSHRAHKLAIKFGPLGRMLGAKRTFDS